MKQSIKITLVAASAFLFFAFGTATRRARAYSSGPPGSHTGAPSENDCTSCHSSFPVNSGLGSVSLEGLPLHYTPGQTINLTVKTVHQDGFLYGFQLTALDAGGAPAGTLVVTDFVNTQLIDGITGGFNRSYLEQTSSGAFPVEFDRRVWTFNWIAPAMNVGPVTFYFAGNGADANGETTGDFIYTGQRTLACTGATPDNQSFTALGGDGALALGSACDWTAVATQDWVAITSAAQGSGQGNLSYTVAANPLTTRRTAEVIVGGATVPVLQGANFLDVFEVNFFYPFIGKLSAHGLTVGCGNGNYCPGDPVTREQMAAFLMRARGVFAPPPPSQQTFVDVPPNNTFFPFIEDLARRGITTGCGNDQLGNRLYCPGDPVTREQMAAFIIRALGEFDPPAPGAQRFEDVPPQNFFYSFIDRMAVLGVTTGCNPPGFTQYCPGGLVTREQMAAFLVRAFGL